MPKTAKKTSKKPKLGSIVGTVRLVKAAPVRRYIATKRGLGMMTRLKKRAAVRPLPFYAKVEVKRRNGVPPEVVGTNGIVLGRAKLKTGQWSYSVFLGGLNESYSLPHLALRPTGEVLQRSDIYHGDVLRVTVDESGTGTVAAN
jgi:hypothetical protein